MEADGSIPCGSCGAPVKMPPNKVRTPCPYCNAQVTLPNAPGAAAPGAAGPQWGAAPAAAPAPGQAASGGGGGDPSAERAPDDIVQAKIREAQARAAGIAQANAGAAPAAPAAAPMPAPAPAPMAAPPPMMAGAMHAQQAAFQHHNSQKKAAKTIIWVIALVTLIPIILVFLLVGLGMCAAVM